ncbi:MAG TPA: hypothetical protein VHT49_06610 [Acidimicrobiales bacterium]|jgi:hypothetical protein|nr:hypothetical protein [Acidimicrobiales bacterium]
MTTPAGVEEATVDPGDGGTLEVGGTEEVGGTVEGADKAFGDERGVEWQAVRPTSIRPVATTARPGDIRLVLRNCRW